MQVAGGVPVDGREMSSGALPPKRANAVAHLNQ